MRQIATTLKDFDLTYGWIIRWLLLMAIGYAVMYADTRYLQKTEVEMYMTKLHQLRGEDMAAIYNRIEAVRAEAVASDKLVRNLEGKMERVIAQNEMILKRLDQ
jgi:hypothetical protein